MLPTLRRMALASGRFGACSYRCSSCSYAPHSQQISLSLSSLVSHRTNSVPHFGPIEASKIVSKNHAPPMIAMRFYTSSSGTSDAVQDDSLKSQTSNSKPPNAAAPASGCGPSFELEQKRQMEENFNELEEILLKRIKKQKKAEEVAQQKQQVTVPVPSPGQASGDAEIDKVTRQWRSVKQQDDDTFGDMYKRIAVAGSTLVEEEEDSDDGLSDYMLDLEKLKKKKSQFCTPYNEETGELYGPRGPEPTTYGDWQGKGRVTDF